MNRLFYLLHQRSRAKKHRLFLEHIRPTPSMRILNVGATGSSSGLEMQFEGSYSWPERVTGGGPNMPELRDYRHSFAATTVALDGCALPFRDRSFDVVYSNAVIEHLTPEQQQQFADEVQRVGKGWFIATPNRAFIVEPHYHLPLVQFLPQPQQRAVAARLGKTPYPVLDLLNKKELGRLFPGSQILGCRVTLYAETLIALRPPS
jgi:hypothetical protein